MEKYLDKTKPRYSQLIFPVRWHSVISRFHCTVNQITYLEIEVLSFIERTYSLTYVLSNPVFERLLNQTFGIILFHSLTKGKTNWPLQRACGSQLRDQFASIKPALLRRVTIDFIKILYVFYLVGYVIYCGAISSFARSPHCSSLRPLLRNYERWTRSESSKITHSALIHCAESLVVFNFFSFLTKRR